MHIHRGLKASFNGLAGSVVTIGNFDGVHLGHKALLEKTTDLARRMNLTPAVISFEPQPGEYFHPETAPARITRLREKACLLEEAGIELLWLLKFNQLLAETNAESFLNNLLIEKLKMKAIVIGDDFRFGARREGNEEYLRTFSSSLDYEVHKVVDLMVTKKRASSTRVREYLANGDFDSAAKLLGYRYRMCGRVCHGNKLGWELGYPTANIAIGRLKTPLHGIYAVKVSITGSSGTFDGVASLGNRPTVDNLEKPVLEVHLFDYNNSLYGQHLCVEFVKFLRKEEKFPNMDTLINQMHQDARQARQILASSA